MRFLIFGGTGPSGIALVRKALDVYPDSTVLVYVRSPQKIPADLNQNPSVVVIPGELAELDKVEAALVDVDVVLSALGPTPFHPFGCPIAKFYDSLIDLMVKHSVKRLFALGTFSFRDPQDKFSLIAYAMVGTVSALAHTAYAEIRKSCKVIAEKGTEKGLLWTIVRVPLLTHQDMEDVVAGYVADGKTGFVLARKGFAAFCIGEIEKKEWIGKAPVISTAKAYI